MPIDFHALINDPSTSQTDRFTAARDWFNRNVASSTYIGDAFAHWVAELPRERFRGTMLDYREEFATDPEAQLYRLIHGSRVAHDGWEYVPGATVLPVSVGGLLHALRDKR